MVDLLHFECIAVKLTHIFTILEQVEITHKIQKLSILNIVFEWGNRDTVGKLCAEGINCIVNDDHVFHIAILKNSEIFDVHIICSLDTIVSIYTMLYKFVLRVNVVEYDICIPTMTCRENNNFKMLVNLLEALPSVRANVKTRL